MKNTKIYESPAMEIVKLDVVDVVTVSDGETLVDVTELFGPNGKWGNIFS